MTSEYDMRHMTPRMSLASHRGSVFNRLNQDTASSAAKKRPPSRGGDGAATNGMPSHLLSPYSPHSPRVLATPRALTTPRTARRPSTSCGVPLTARPSTANSAMSMRPPSSHRRMAAPRFLEMRPRYTGTTTTAPQLDPNAVHDPDTDLDKFLGSSDNIQVVVQLRDANPAALAGLPLQPPNGTELCAVRSSPTTMTVYTAPQPHAYAFDYVAGPNTSRDSLHALIGHVLVGNVLEGYNSTLMAYGQTGSGKTHVMLGDLGNTQEEGLVPRILSQLFASLQALQQATPEGHEPPECFFSAVEVYNEGLVDLLEPTAGHLAVREDYVRGMYVDGALEVAVNNVENAMELLQYAVQHRTLGATSLNTQASRSHLVLTLMVQRPVVDPEGEVHYMYSRLNLVDLAGSERQRGGPSMGALATGHAREVSHINRSLSTLGKVIMSVAANQTGRPQHVPYRDSKLTYLLQDALGGNAKTVLLATVSPLAANMAETLTTLRFAHRAKSIVNSAVVNTAPAGMVLRVPSGKGSAVVTAEALLDVHKQAGVGDDARIKPLAHDDDPHSTSPRIMASHAPVDHHAPPSLDALLQADLAAMLPPQADRETLTDTAQRLAVMLAQVRRRLADGAPQGGSGDATPSSEDAAAGESRWQLAEDVELLRAEVEAQYAAAGAQKASLKAATVELTGLKSALSIKEGELREARNQVLELQEVVEQQEALEAAATTQLAALQDEVVDLRRFKADTEVWHEEVKTYVGHLEQEVSMYRGRAHAAEDQLRQARLQADSAVSGRRAMQAQLEAAESAQAGLEAELVGCKALLEDYQQKFAAQVQECAQD